MAANGFPTAVAGDVERHIVQPVEKTLLDEGIVIVGTQMAMPGGKVQIKQGRITPEPKAATASSAPTGLSLAGQATFAR